MKRILYGMIIVLILAFVGTGVGRSSDKPITNLSVISGPFGTGSLRAERSP